MNAHKLASIANRVAAEVLKEEMGITSEMDNAVVEFLLNYPFPGDAEVHAFAEERGYDTEQVEAAAYRLASLFVQFLNDGRANEKGFKEEDADPEQVKMGIEIEHEHSPDRATAKRITLDHLAENPKSPLPYYTALVWMEKLMESLSKMSKEEAEAKIARVKQAIEE
jgi:hypothetical protein